MIRGWYRPLACAALGAVLLTALGFSDDVRGQDASTIVVATGDLGASDWMPQLTVGTNRIVYDLVNETLVSVDSEGNLVPRLAKSWEVSDGGKTWRFTLQEGVEFHDGWGELTAEDVKFTWKMFTSEDSLLSRAKVWRDAVGGDVEKNFEIVNDHEFILHGDTSNVLLPLVLTYPEDTLQIQSRRYWEEAGEEKARRHPVGTGPYKFVSEDPGGGVQLDAVEDHWRHTPGVKNIVIRVVSDEAARLAQVRAGEVDIAQIPPALATEAQAVGLDLVLAENAYMCNVILGGIYPFEDLEEGFSSIHKPDLPWVQDDNPEKGLAIRKAMSLAIDRELIADTLMSGMGKPIRATMQLAFIADRAMDPAEHDPEEARRLMEEGGYPDGFTIDMPIFKQSGREAGADIGHAVAGMWEEHLGLKVNRLPMEFEPTFRAHIEQRTTGDPWPGSDGVGKVNVFCQPFRDEPATQLVTSISPGGAFTQFHHAAAQELIPKILNEADRAERNRMHAELGRRIADDYTSFGIVAGAAPFVISDRIARYPVLPGRGEYNNLEYVELN